MENKINIAAKYGFELTSDAKYHSRWRSHKLDVVFYEYHKANDPYKYEIVRDRRKVYELYEVFVDGPFESVLEMASTIHLNNFELKIYKAVKHGGRKVG